MLALALLRRSCFGSHFRAWGLVRPVCLCFTFRIDCVLLIVCMICIFLLVHNIVTLHCATCQSPQFNKIIFLLNVCLFWKSAFFLFPQSYKEMFKLISCVIAIFPQYSVFGAVVDCDIHGYSHPVIHFSMNIRPFIHPDIHFALLGRLQVLCILPAHFWMVKSTSVSI